MSRWGQESTGAFGRAPPTARHPDLDDLPPLPREFESIFVQAAESIKEIANNIKEQRNKKTMQHFGGGEGPREQDGSSDAAAATTGNARGRLTTDMMVPAHRAGLVIGHHGETLKRIEKMSQCKIQFDQQYAGNEHERRVIIVGIPEDIEEAKRLIREKVEDQFARFPTAQVMVPQGRVGLVIGKGGETIRELQEKSGAKVTVQPESSADPYSSERAINITGDEESIRRAKDLINELLTGQARGGYLGSGALGSHRNATTIQIPESSVGAVIGKRAETLRTLQTMSGCRIYVEPSSAPGGGRDRDRDRDRDPNSAPEFRNVHLTGAPEQVAYAQQLIMEKVTQNESSYYAAAAAYDPANQPSVLYENPAGLIGGIGTSGAVEGGTGYDYSQYYYQYYQQMAAAAAGGQAADESQMASQQPQPGQYDYSAYYNYYQQQPPQQ